MAGRWVLDKVLHNRYIIDVAVLQRAKAKCVITIRRPSEAISSIFRMRQALGEPEPVRSICDYYIKRLDVLRSLGQQMQPRDAFCFEGERLLDASESLLDLLSRFLNLSSPLRKEYTVFDDTGQRGKGDVSEVVQSGVIKQRKETESSSICEQNLDRAWDSYASCREALKHLRWVG